MLSNPHYHPDLIVLDLNIPQIPGMTLLELRKDDPTPKVVLSSSVNPEARKLRLASRAQEFVSKPVELEEFQKVVARIIEHWELRVASVDRSVVACAGSPQ